MLLKSRELDAASLAAELAALLSDRDLLRAGAGTRDSDVRTRLEALRGGGAAGSRRRWSACDARNALRAAAGPRAARRAPTVDRGRRAAGAGVPGSHRRAGAPGGEGRYQLANGRGAVFEGAESIARAGIHRGGGSR